MATDMTVANTILAQLGGKRFIAMTGANSFTGDKNSLTFKLPQKKGYVKQGICGVRVVLTPADDYNIEFIAFRGSFAKGDFRCETVSKAESVYCDMLCEVFTNHTGLRTSL
jgi:hypothetical protein